MSERLTPEREAAIRAWFDSANPGAIARSMSFDVLAELDAVREDLALERAGRRGEPAPARSQSILGDLVRERALLRQKLEDMQAEATRQQAKHEALAESILDYLSVTVGLGAIEAHLARGRSRKEI